MSFVAGFILRRFGASLPGLILSRLVGRRLRGGPPELRVRIRGMRRILRALDQAERAVRPSGGLGRATYEVGLEVLKHSRAITHVDTGALASSHRMRHQSLGAASRALIFIDPSAINPVSGQRPADYGLVEHARGGSHAFYERTYEHFKRGQGAAFIRAIRRNLP